jgi:hypothetical protein
VLVLPLPLLLLLLPLLLLPLLLPLVLPLLLPLLPLPLLLLLLLPLLLLLLLRPVAFECGQCFYALLNFGTATIPVQSSRVQAQYDLHRTALHSVSQSGKRACFGSNGCWRAQRWQSQRRPC